jgi:hypothetical protein
MVTALLLFWWIVVVVWVREFRGLGCEDMYAKPEVGSIGNREETERDIV